MIRLDANMGNADWTKQTWDLGIDNIDDLLEYLQDTNMSPEHFMTLPVYQYNVNKLSWLKELAKYTNKQ